MLSSAFNYHYFNTPDPAVAIPAPNDNANAGGLPEGGVNPPAGANVDEVEEPLGVNDNEVEEHGINLQEFFANLENPPGSPHD
ncbi:hypothetical protein BGZ49_009272 [Haplosporangium sp. Z 27]|nr:hypothetical protein BGZ49_009272 [Haplosporangium sp. Z 27]